MRRWRSGNADRGPCGPAPYRVHSIPPKGEDLSAMSKEIRLLSTSAILGYGFPEASLRAGLDRDPHFIGVEGGSVDPGPHNLGAPKPFSSPLAIPRDLPLILCAPLEKRLPTA